MQSLELLLTCLLKLIQFLFDDLPLMVLTVQSVLVNRSAPFFARKWFRIRYLGVSQTSCQILWYLRIYYYLLKCSSPLNKNFEIWKKSCIILWICGDITERNSIVITHLTMQITLLFLQLKMSLILWLQYLLILFMWQKGIFKVYPSWLTKAKPQEMLVFAQDDLRFTAGRNCSFGSPRVDCLLEAELTPYSCV